MKNFSQLEIPGYGLIMMIVICLYSRDGMLMKKQVDTLFNTCHLEMLTLFALLMLSGVGGAVCHLCLNTQNRCKKQNFFAFHIVHRDIGKVKKFGGI